MVLDAALGLRNWFLKTRWNRLDETASISFGRSHDGCRFRCIPGSLREPCMEAIGRAGAGRTALDCNW